MKFFSRVFTAAAVFGCFLTLMTVLSLFYVGFQIGNREYGVSSINRWEKIYEWKLRFHVMEGPSHSSGVDPSEEHSFGGFGYEHHPLAKGYPTPVVVGWIAQIFIPLWFVVLLWIVAAFKAVLVLRRLRRSNRGFEVTPQSTSSSASLPR